MSARVWGRLGWIVGRLVLEGEVVVELVAIFIFFKQMGFIITSLILILGPFFTFFHYIILVLKLLFFPKKTRWVWGR